MKPENLDKCRIWPRLLITLYGLAFYRVTEWFMQLEDPTNAQSAFVSVLVGAGAAWFGLVFELHKPFVRVKSSSAHIK